MQQTREAFGLDVDRERPEVYRPPNRVTDAQLFQAIQGLSDNAKAVLKLYLAQAHERRPRPSDNAVSKRLNLKLRVVREAQDELLAAGLLVDRNEEKNDAAVG